MAQLSVVTDETPPKKPMSLTEAVEHGTRRDELIALRKVVAKAIQNPKTPAPALAALARQLVLMSKELEALDAGTDGDEVGGAAAMPDATWDGGDI